MSDEKPTLPGKPTLQYRGARDDRWSFKNGLGEAVDLFFGALCGAIFISLIVLLLYDPRPGWGWIDGLCAVAFIASIVIAVSMVRRPPVVILESGAHWFMGGIFAGAAFVMVMTMFISHGHL